MEKKEEVKKDDPKDVLDGTTVAPKDALDGTTVAPKDATAPAVDLPTAAAATGADTVTQKKPLPIKEKKSDEVVMSREEFNALMSRLDKLTTDQTLLFQAADKSRLSKIMNQEGTNLIKTCRIKTWDGTGIAVIASKLMTNRCEVVMGKWIEEQTIAVVLEDGQNFTVSYLEFVRKTLNKITGEIVGKNEETDSEGHKQIILKIKFPNGKELLINSSFVN